MWSTVLPADSPSKDRHKEARLDTSERLALVLRKAQSELARFKVCIVVVEGNKI